MELTALDKALKAVKTASAKPEEFYNLFLSTSLIIPTWSKPEKTEERLAGENETFDPVIIESDGEKFLMLFDTTERLVSWAKREVGYIAVPGYAIVEMSLPGVQWVLNVECEYMHQFVLDEIAWLKSCVQAAGPGASKKV